MSLLRPSFCNSCDCDQVRFPASEFNLPEEYWICGGCGRLFVDVWNGTATFECPDENGLYLQDKIKESN